MESIVVGVKSLFELSISRVEQSIINTMEKNNVSADIVTSVHGIFSEGADLFKGLSTTYQQNEYFKKNFSFVVSIIASIVKC